MVTSRRSALSIAWRRMRSPFNVRVGWLVSVVTVRCRASAITGSWRLTPPAAPNSHEVLRAATLGSSEVIGRADRAGQYRGGQVRGLADSRSRPARRYRQHTSRCSFVMKNGRLYDADTLDEVWPRQQPFEPQWFWNDAEPTLTPPCTGGERLFFLPAGGLEQEGISTSARTRRIPAG